jgi:5-methylcytosine-specific restriction endonuclease McrA
MARCHSYIEGQLIPKWRMNTVKPCGNCKSLFWFSSKTVEQQKNTFCSQQCYNKFVSAQVNRICQFCNASFNASKCYLGRGGGKYCSSVCYEKSKVGKVHLFKDKESWALAISKGNQGKGKLKGEQCWNWKGGITLLNVKIRSSIEYRNWRTSVFIRDNRTCQICGYHGPSIQADHIMPFSTHPELRFEKNNGRTLCKECHKIITRDMWQSGTISKNFSSALSI